jgi:hypothetical protein
MLFSLLSLREREIKFGGKRRAVGAGGLFTVVVAFLARHLLENSLSAVLSCCCARGFALKSSGPHFEPTLFLISS